MLVVLLALVIAGSVYSIRQRYPRASSFAEAGGCYVLGIVTSVADSQIDKADASAADKAELRKGIGELRSQYTQSCEPLTK